MLLDYTSDFDSGVKYPSLAKFKDARKRENFNYHKHILKVKEHFIDSIVNYQINTPYVELSL